MPDQEYDVFLSHAGEDTAWCETLAERLRNEGVRVWFDQWELQPGDNLLARINGGLARSRKMIAVWSANYFRDGKVWTLVESFSQLHGDPLSQDRPIIPLLIEDCTILPTFRNILFIDFRNQPDFDLRFRQLLQALDLPRREFAREEEIEFREYELDLRERGRRAFKKGKRFEDEVATLYRLLGFEVKQDTQLSGVQIDLQVQQKMGGLLTQAIVECKDKRITANERDQILAQQNLAQKKLPVYRWIAVSSEGFAAETRLALEEAGVSCLTYAELLAELVPLDQYNEHLIAEYETWVTENWRGEDWYIRPHLLTDIIYEKQPALSHFAKWLGDSRSNFLVVLGDLGTGKSTLARFLAYHLAKSFASDPLRHPAPVLIPLKEVRKENSLESLIISHFSKRGLSGVSFPRFEHLVRLGKIILLFDAFDEMADRVRWEVTKSNFTELRRAADPGGAGKVILTCRTHYFKDRNEQVKLIGQGPRLSEIETELYRELRQQSNAEVVYLQEFDDEQIKAYLHKARSQTALEDWQKIQSIYNLKELAQRPLLLEMIVKSLPKLAAGQTINAANLYTVYTNIWVEREEQKGRILDKQIKLQLMLELAWRLWHEKKDAIHYHELAPFVEKLAVDKILEFGDEEAEDIAREMQTATFIKRDESGNFSFLHRSFMEFFLARKIYEEMIGVGHANFQPPVLNTWRFDRKIVYFLTWLDAADGICPPLQQLLRNAYVANVSENALQILYWSGRIRAGMEDKIEAPAKLREAMLNRIPAGAQFAGAKLQEIVLEAADLTEANFTQADLTKANLNHAHLAHTCFDRAILQEARAENIFAFRADFRATNLQKTALQGASLAESDFTGALYDPIIFMTADVRNCKGLALASKLRRENLQPVVQRIHASGVNAVAYNPNGELLVSAGRDGVIRVYRASDCKLLRSLEEHQYAINSVHFSPDGEKLASGGSDKSVRLWEVKSGKLLRSLEGHQYAINSVHFSPDGEKLASGSDDNTVRLWAVKNGKLLWSLKGHTVHFSPDGERLVSGSSDKSVRLWETKSGKLLCTLEGRKGWGQVSSVHFSPNGEYLASGSTDKSVRLWETKSGKLLHTLKGHPGEVRSVHFSPDGECLASSGVGKSVRLWETKSGKLLATLKGHQNDVNMVHFSPDGEFLASGSIDKSVRLWEVKSGKLLRTLQGNQGEVGSVHFSPDGEYLACGNTDKSVWLWKIKSGEPLRMLQGNQGEVGSVHFSPDGGFLVTNSSDNSVRLWEVKSGELLRSLEGHRGMVHSVHFSPDGEKLASGSDDRSVRLWEVKNGHLLRSLEGHRSTVISVHFSPNGEKLASGGSDNSVRLWEVKSGQLLWSLEGHKSMVLSVHFSPDGEKLVSGSYDQSVRLWEVKSGNLLRSLEGHQYGVNSVYFSPDGQKLASGSDDHTVRLWEVETGKCLQVLAGHLGPVYTVCFSPNSKYLVAAGAAGRLQFWDVEKGETFLYRYAFGPGAWLDLLPDGRFDASPEGMRYLCYTEQGTLNSYTAEELVKEFYDPNAVQDVLAKYVK